MMPPKYNVRLQETFVDLLAAEEMVAMLTGQFLQNYQVFRFDFDMNGFKKGKGV